ncbi:MULTISPECIES: hypothetical protein [Butyricimonas]|uniref:hypothetical protein n=1 Tax=Butyricimonas TaxID=574697 RepID=UPI001D061807|nr:MULTISPECIES: hypothetical protein [Butyricimonas]MCB6971725.1 hypothetical protein [Butyricimonas synergistica]MCG4518668.1 hypothetical protein [Butyricimonas sp. DFI.6.44]
MKKIIISILFVSVVLGLTLVNVTLRNDATNIDIKLKNIEAFGENEGGDENPCIVIGSLCMYYDKDQNPVFYPGLALDVK